MIDPDQDKPRTITVRQLKLLLENAFLSGRLVELKKRGAQQLSVEEVAQLVTKVAPQPAKRLSQLFSEAVADLESERIAKPHQLFPQLESLSPFNHSQGDNPCLVQPMQKSRLAHSAQDAIA
jgi:hypothetical protein